MQNHPHLHHDLRTIHYTTQRVNRESHRECKGVFGPSYEEHARASYKWEKRRQEDDKGTWCIKMSVLWLFQPHCEQTNGAEWRKVLKLQMKALIISPLSHGCSQCVACVAPICLRCQWPQPVFERFPVREASVISEHFESQKLKVRLADIVETDPMSKPDEQPLFNATRETFI